MLWLAQTDIVSNITIVERLGLIGLLMIILIGGARGWWVFGKTYDQLLKDRDLFRDMALRATRAAESSADVGNKLARDGTDLNIQIQELQRTLEKAQKGIEDATS